METAFINFQYFGPKICGQNPFPVLFRVIRGLSYHFFVSIKKTFYLCALISRMIRNHALKNNTMKKGIHPENYRLVVFKDMSNEETFITRSTAPSRETITVDGVEYPLIKVEISNTSHPFYTGKSMFIDTAGRIEKFKKRYAKKD
jgi:large subunit ribosomal protein L31